MTKEMVLAKVNAHNAKVDYFDYVQLPQLLGIEDGQEVTAEEWFGLWAKSYSLRREQKFYEEGMALVEQARAEGYDVKINAQTDKVTAYI